MSFIQDPLPAREAIPRNPPARHSPNRASSVFSAQNTRSSKGYWNNLLCMFEGLSFDPTISTGATSLNNKEYFQPSSRPQSRDPAQERPRANTLAPKHSSSILGSSSTPRRRSASGGVLGRIRRSKASIDSTTSVVEGSTLAAVPESDQDTIGNPSSMASIPTTSSLEQPRMIAIQKDGQTVWIPEAVVERYSLPAVHPAQPSSANKYKRPDMKISIPQWPSQPAHGLAPRPPMPVSMKSEGSVYPDAAGNTVVMTRNGERLVAPSPDRQRPVHPLEQGEALERTSIGSSPISPHSRDSSNSSGRWSAGSSQYSAGTSRSSFEVATHKDISPVGRTSNKSLSVTEPVRYGGYANSPTHVPPPIQARNPMRASAMPGSVMPTAFAGNAGVTANPVQTPTLSQAASELERELSLRGLATPDVIMRILAEYQSTPISTPPIPSRSMKRAVPAADAVPESFETPIRRNRQSFGDLSKAVHERFGQSNANLITPDTAENVIYQIFQRVQGLEDLFSLARINHGFYDVFKRNELELAKTALRNSDPAACEHLEVSPPQSISSISLPVRQSAGSSSFFQYSERLRQDTYTLAALKSIILNQCKSFIRPKTIEALTGRHPERATRVDNALWRIWTFCDMFGGASDCEDDVPAQSAWLRGFPGPVSSGSIPSLQYPSAKELYGMTELWNCMRALLSGISGAGRLAQARAHGVFAGQSEIPSDVPAMQEYALEEWINYLLTLGPAVVLELSKHTLNNDDNVFAAAAKNGWTKWHPPSPLYGRTSKSRRNFLKEAVSRVYEEKIVAEAKAKSRGPRPTTTPANATTSTSTSSHSYSPSDPERTTTQSRRWAHIARRAHGQVLASQLRNIKAEHAAIAAATSTGCLPDELKSKRISDERPMSLLAEVLAREKAKAKQQKQLRKSKLSTVTGAEDASKAGDTTPMPSVCGASLEKPFDAPLDFRVPSVNVESDAGDLTPTVETPLVYPPALATLMAEAMSHIPPVPKLCPATVKAVHAKVVTPAATAQPAPAISRKPVPDPATSHVIGTATASDEPSTVRPRLLAPPLLEKSSINPPTAQGPPISSSSPAPYIERSVPPQQGQRLEALAAQAPALLSKFSSSPPTKAPPPPPTQNLPQPPSILTSKAPLPPPSHPPPPPPLDLVKVAARLAEHQTRNAAAIAASQSQSQLQTKPLPQPQPNPKPAPHNSKPTPVPAKRKSSLVAQRKTDCTCTCGHGAKPRAQTTPLPVPRSRYAHTVERSDWPSISFSSSTTEARIGAALDEVVSPLSICARGSSLDACEGATVAVFGAAPTLHRVHVTRAGEKEGDANRNESAGRSKAGPGMASAMPLTAAMNMGLKEGVRGGVKAAPKRENVRMEVRAVRGGERRVLEGAVAGVGRVDSMRDAVAICGKPVRGGWI